MFSRMKAAFGRSEADRLAAVLDAQRAEQRNAEARLTRLREARDRVAHRLGPEDRDGRLAAHDREIAWMAQRVKDTLRLQAQLLARLGEMPELVSTPRA